MYLASVLLAVVMLCVTAGPMAGEKPMSSEGSFYSDLFETFKYQYGKTYTSAFEEDRRREIFGKNLDFIEEHNKQYMLGKSSFYLGVNEYTDLELHEFLGNKGGSSRIRSSVKVATFRPTAGNDYPSEVDWRKNGSVTPVRNQGNCHADWAFSAVGALEGQYYLGQHKMISFSMQQLIDCPNSQQNFTTFGCAGGIPTNAYLSISEIGGIEADSDYPYEAKNGTCRFNSSLVKTSIGGWVEMGDSPNEDTLQQMVVTYGPLSVRIDGNHSSFQHYKGGIYDEANCSNTTLNSAALLVGYSTTPEYWIVKNSLGLSWGEQGYIRMSRNKFNQCGIANNASVPF